MIMRDVLDGMQDLALSSALRSGPGGGQVLWIGPPRSSQARNADEGPAEILEFSRHRNIACS